MNQVMQQAVRTPMPGMTRQSAATAPIASRGAQFRAADLQRGAPAQRGAAKDEDKDRESLFNRDEDKDKDDDLDDANTAPNDDDSKDDDRKDDDDKDGKPV
jgi:hypothetical protein